MPCFILASLSAFDLFLEMQFPSGVLDGLQFLGSSNLPASAYLEIIGTSHWGLGSISFAPRNSSKLLGIYLSQVFSIFAMSFPVLPSGLLYPQSRKILTFSLGPSLPPESLRIWGLIKTELRAPVPPTGLGTCSLSPWHHCHHGLLPCLQHPGNLLDFPLALHSSNTIAIFPTFELHGNLIGNTSHSTI